MFGKLVKLCGDLMIGNKRARIRNPRVFDSVGLIVPGVRQNELVVVRAVLFGPVELRLGLKG